MIYPQLILIALSMFSLTLHLAQHGQERTSKVSFPSYFVAVVIQTVLLYWGGFYDELIRRLANA